jgi:DNA-binding SARP family transcriptional activator
MAFAKTYGKSSRQVAALGQALARRTTPPLIVHDLGQVALKVGDRRWSLSSMRRKAAALLMYLVSRPNFTAGREQILEQLWPDSDPTSASNNLNQSLFYLRRDIDPWYEDGLSVEYVGLRADVVSIDAALLQVASVDFVASARAAMSHPPTASTIRLIESYRGQFSPEFEYEEWAMAWRTRVHAHYLQVGNWTVDQLTAAGDFAAASDVAVSVLGIDPDAHELEQKLIALYWKQGHKSAAETQFEHLAAREREDGLAVSRFRDLIDERKEPPIR